MKTKDSSSIQKASYELARNLETNQNFFPNYFNRNKSVSKKFKELILYTNHLLLKDSLGKGVYTEKLNTIINLFDFYFFAFENYYRLFTDTLKVLSTIYPLLFEHNEEESDYPETLSKRKYRFFKLFKDDEILTKPDKLFIEEIKQNIQLHDSKEISKCINQLERLFYFYNYIKCARKKDFDKIIKVQRLIKEFELFFYRNSDQNKNEIFRNLRDFGFGEESTITRTVKKYRRPELQSKKQPSGLTIKAAKKGIRITIKIIKLIDSRIRPRRILKKLLSENKFDSDLIYFAVIRAVYMEFFEKENLTHMEIIQKLSDELQLGEDIIAKYLE